MKIKNIKLEFNKYQMKNILKSSSYSHNYRESWTLVIEDDLGNKGLGEASPLPQFNNETIIEAGYALEGFKLALTEIDSVELEELIILSEVHSIDVPSATFAIQTAIYDILSKRHKISMSRFLNENSLLSVKSNGIYNLTDLEKYDTIKIKCGFRNLFDELSLIKGISQKYSNCSLVIDLNQSYDINKAIRFFKEVAKYNIKYIEQPISRNNIEDIEELRYHTEIPIALDESVTDLDSIKKLLQKNVADVFILKPQSIGSFNKIQEAIKIINDYNKIPIITCSLEGSIGRFSTMHLVAVSEMTATCGLAMEKIYNHENHHFPKINDGNIRIFDKPGIGI
tara:strand:- start:2767 stop:3783 length:1017 start_codon:yes stop_codon:yes gene_type:complete